MYIVLQVLSIEGSMEGNQHNYGRLLHAVVALFSCTLFSLSLLGYLRYGENTAQILVQNLPSGSPLVMCVNSLLIVGVLCTYPLMIFPVIEIVEGYLFTEGMALFWLITINMLHLVYMADIVLQARIF